MKVNVVNRSGFELPKYETKNSAGLDVRVFTGDEEVHWIKPGERKLLKTGLSLEIPEGYECQVRPRSGLAIKYGVTVLNSPGTIDADYRGEVGIILLNTSREPFSYRNGDRVAQLVFNKVDQVRLKEVEKIDDTIRGKGGFGSTGVK